VGVGRPDYPWALREQLGVASEAKARQCFFFTVKWKENQKAVLLYAEPREHELLFVFFC